MPVRGRTVTEQGKWRYPIEAGAYLAVSAYPIYRVVKAVVDGKIDCASKACHEIYTFADKPVDYGLALASWIIFAVALLALGSRSVYLIILRSKAAQDESAAAKLERLQVDFERKLDRGWKARKGPEIPIRLAALVMLGVVVVLLIRAYLIS